MSRTKKITLIASAAAGILVGAVLAVTKYRNRNAIVIINHHEAPDFVEKGEDLG